MRKVNSEPKSDFQRKDATKQEEWKKKMEAD